MKVTVVPFLLLCYQNAPTAAQTSTCDSASEYLVRLVSRDFIGNAQELLFYSRIYDTVQGVDVLRDAALQWDDTSGTVEVCLPKNSCYMAELGSFSGDIYDVDIIVDGSFVQDSWTHPDGPIPGEPSAFEYREFGDCQIQCQADESVLLVEMSQYGFEADWRVEKPSLAPLPTEVEARCGISCTSFIDAGRWFSFPYSRERFCLKSDECHLLVVGDAGVRTYRTRRFTSVNVTFSDERVVSLPAVKRFEAYDFGGAGCSLATHEEEEGSHTSMCGENSDDQALLEVFLFRNIFEGDGVLPPMSLHVEDSNTGDTILNVDGPVDVPQEDGLDYIRACVPKSCSSLSLFVPELDSIHGNRKSEEYLSWFISMDGTILQDKSVTIVEIDTANTRLRGWEHSINIGNCVQCNSNESSVEFDFFAEADGDSLDFYKPFFWKIGYILFDDDEDHSGRPAIYDVDSPTYYDGYIGGRSYHVAACIPSKYCTEFMVFVDDGDASLDISIKVDGEMRDNVKADDSGNRIYDPVFLDGRFCKTGFSTGKVVGISIGAALGGAAVVAMGYHCWMAQKQHRNQSHDSTGSTKVPTEDPDEVDNVDAALSSGI